MNKPEIKAGDIVTLFSNNAMAMTSETRMHIISDYPTHFVFKEAPRKRKRFTCKKGNPKTMAFYGEIPFTSDYNAPAINGTKTWRGNCLFNLVSEKSPAEIRAFIEENLLWEIDIDTKARIVVIRPENNTSNYEYNVSELVYPELNTHCGPLDDIKRLG